MRQLIYSATTSDSSVLIDDLESKSLLQLRQDESAAIYGGIVTAQSPKAENLTPAPHLPTQTSRSAKPTVNPTVSWSPALQTLLDQPPSSLPRHLIVGGLVFGAALAVWAWFGKVQEVSHAQGRLVPQGELYKIQPVTQGEVARLSVVEGQSVKGGQVIAELDQRLASSEVDRLKQILVASELQLFQTQELIARTKLEAQTRRAIAAAGVQAQTASIQQAQAQTRSIQTLLPQLQTEKAAYESRLVRLQPLVAEGAIAEDRLFEVEQTLRQHQQTITQNQGELEQAKSEGDRLQAGLTEKQAEAQKSDLETQQQLQQLKMQAAQVEAKIAETQAEMQAARARVGDLLLYAPVNGTVTSLKIHNPGEVAQPGQTIAEIAPAGVPLVLSALLPTQEAGLVQQGMAVQIKFDAFPYQNYGLVSGTVMTISPDAEPHEQMGTVYRVKISLDRSSMTRNHQTIQLKAGQTGRAEIIVRQRRIIDILLDPIRQLQKGGINL